MEEVQPGQRVAEVTASQSQRVEAQCYEAHATPPLGSLVRIGSPPVYAVVLDVRHEPLDPTRPLTPRGADLETEDEVYAANPQLSAILTTRFTAAIVGFRDGASIRAGLPSLPPDLHSFVFLCDDADLAVFGVDFGWLRLLLDERSPASDTAIANLLRQAANTRTDSRKLLLDAGKALATELFGDPLRLRSLLREVGG
ncbi:MAG: hypothetical protein OXL37_06865 [Chloroflexota bacterium]|nr:hypothetical protein [Chloroflexota bacterium]MDE2960780.1 hypothetical protein [Chloroflexota bacterium]